MRKAFAIIILLLSVSSQLFSQVSEEAIPYTEYTVRWFDSLSDISAKYNVPKDVILIFNGLESDKIPSRTVLRIPTRAQDFERILASAPVVVPSVEEPSVSEEVTVAAGSGAASGSVEQAPARESYRHMWFREPVREPEHNLALLLPFNLTLEATPDSLGLLPKPSPDYKDFYTGVLMACREAGLEGINVNLSTYDISYGGTRISDIDFTGKDAVIGPVSYPDIMQALTVLPSGTTLLSPLNKNLDTLSTRFPNFMSAPSRIGRLDLLDWALESAGPSDNIVIISEVGTKLPGEVLSRLIETRTKYQSFYYDLLDNKEIELEMAKVFTKDARNVVYVASQKSAFVADVVRNLNILATFKDYEFPMTVFADGSIVYLAGSEIDNFHNTNLHTILSYYIDYNDPKVVSFVSDYRALFDCEPSRFAFQGYDLAGYLLKSTTRGLQSDFHFVQSGAGQVNTAARHIVYRPGYQISLLPAVQ
ncbi:MAG: LysM peptidoglycan-binding domain-containing protein [Bacteroidales bacterium]|nr:LysM peptidoglycan-binding domain-containing protein [Bacteroidales bacterium]